MSCPANRCALRRFDGHGTKYKPNNPAAAAEAQSALSRMMAERDLQDAGIFTAKPAPIPIKEVKQKQVSKEAKSDSSTVAPFYSLSS